MSEIPPEIPISVIARACGISRRAAARRIRHAGILVMAGLRAVAPRAAFRERLPDHYENVLRWYRDHARSNGQTPPPGSRERHWR
jgi:hypothetical protein